MSAERKYEASPRGHSAAVRQGEILSNLLQPRIKPETLNLGEPIIDLARHPFVLVASQDCDLDQDFRHRFAETQNHDQLLPNVLFCEVVAADVLKGGAAINSTIWKAIRINKNERYHFLEQVPPGSDLGGEGLPELGVDFKRYFTIPTELLYAQMEEEGRGHRRCRLVSPYLEHFSTRFSVFQSRIALPEDHHSAPAAGR